MEEDIDIVKDMINNCEEHIKKYNEAFVDLEEIKSVKNIINALIEAKEANRQLALEIKKIQKENEEWQKAYQEEKDAQFNILKNSISKSVIQDKIKKETDIVTNLAVNLAVTSMQNMTIKLYQQARIQILQELLEEDEHGENEGD